MLRGLLAALAAAALIAGCGGSDVKTYKEPRGTISVDRGKRFAVEFRVNSGVGIGWRAVGLPNGLGLVALEKTTTHYRDEDRAGESGTKRFEYEAQRKGRQALVFQREFQGRLRERRTVFVVVR